MTLDWAEEYRLKILTQYIKGSANVLADSLSRKNQIIYTSYLHLKVCEPLWKVWGLPSDRPIRYQAKLQTSKLRLPLSRPNGRSDGCLPTRLEPSGLICVSSVHTDKEGHQQIQDNSGIVSHSDSTILATESMVPGSHRPCCRCASIKFIAYSKRPSTTVNYQYKWNKFKQWCKQQGHTVSSPSS